MRKLVTLALGLALLLIPRLASAQAALVMVTYGTKGDATVSIPAQTIIHNYIDMDACKTASQRAVLQATIPTNEKAPSLVMSFVCVPIDKAF